MDEGKCFSENRTSLRKQISLDHGNTKYFISKVHQQKTDERL